MYLPSVWHLDSVQTIKLGEESVWIFFDMSIIVPQDFSQKLVFGMMDRLNNVFVVPREVKKASTFSRRSKLRKDVFAGQRH